jgi:dipeptidyl aminopeptidase/acylaminoacyl peptidase
VIEERAGPRQRLDFNSSFYQAPNVHVTASGEAIWWSERDGWGHLYRYDAASGELRQRLTEGPWLVRDLLAVDERARRIYFTAGGREPGNPYYRHIYRVDFDGRGLTHLSPEAADHNVSAPARAAIAGLDGSIGYRALSPSGKYLVYTFSTPSQPPETVIRRTADGGLIGSVEKADASGLFAVGYRPPVEFTVNAADGRTDLWGVMYLPARFDSTLSYPVVDAEYTSPMVAVTPRTFVAAVASLPASTAAALAQLGFVGVVLDSRGTTSRDRTFNHAMYGKLDTMGLDDHVAAIRELARRHRFIDTTRVGIAGESFGGWSTIRALLEYPDFFKVGVAGSAPGAFHSMYSFGAFQGPPIYRAGEKIPENYLAVDTRRLADRLKGKLLMSVSELDENVLPGSTLQLIDAFLRADKDVDVLYFPDTGHGAGRYTGHYFRREWDYFVRHLMGTEPPPYVLRFP